MLTQSKTFCLLCEFRSSFIVVVALHSISFRHRRLYEAIIDNIPTRPLPVPQTRVGQRAGHACRMSEVGLNLAKAGLGNKSDRAAMQHRILPSRSARRLDGRDNKQLQVSVVTSWTWPGRTCRAWLAWLVCRSGGGNVWERVSCHSSLAVCCPGLPQRPNAQALKAERHAPRSPAAPLCNALFLFGVELPTRMLPYCTRRAC